jgi:dTDP-glucose 4,6-dehydratase
VRVLVTGGAGFIASHLSKRLIQQGDKVLCIDNLVTGSLDNISAIQGSPNFEFIQHDISKPFFPEGNIDFVLHFASPASPIDYLKLPIQTLKVGALGTHNSLGIAKDKKAKFLLASTSEVYGDPHVHPQPESYWGHVNPIGPRGVYDEAKRFAEAITMAYHRTHGISTRIVRIFNTYGPRMRIKDGRAIPAFVTQALRDETITVFGKGAQTRSFCYIDDLVDGIIRFMSVEYHEPVNIGNPNEMSILQLAREILKLIPNSKSKISFNPLPVDDPKQRRPDISCAKKLLGWQPKVSLKDGLTMTIPWFASALSGKS